MCCIVLQCVQVCCSVFKCVAVSYTMSVLHCVAMSVLHCVAMSVLHCVAVSYTCKSCHASESNGCVAVCCSVLQCAPHANQGMHLKVIRAEKAHHK